MLGSLQYAFFRDDGDYATITHWSPKLYKDSVEFLEMFSNNIQAQDWENKSTLKYVLIKEIENMEVEQQ